MGVYKMEQQKLFNDKIELEVIDKIIGSGYETKIAELALADGVAYRAARKNMQIHSAIVLKINGEFSGFFTYQVNHDVGEFCLLQSAMNLQMKDREVYSMMVKKIIEQNTYGYPMIMTVSRKHDLERPDVFHKLGFKTYLIKSGFEYIVYGELSQIRLKLLAHIAMTNLWNSTSGEWLKIKKEWNARIENAGKKYGIENPRFATREGCWQGSSGFSNVVLSKQTVKDNQIITDKSKSLNGNASVLDPTVCEIILRMFMPVSGQRIYNPFGGGVQMGFVAGYYGYEYLATEIRKNQCDANNAICKDYKNVRWGVANSSKYRPVEMYDMIFACPPYYRVEKYIDYDGLIPEGELNIMDTYDEFRDALFSGYKSAIQCMEDNTFFVIMVGDSRNKRGGYYGMEAEHELFFREQGLHIYNRIVYLESEFTRRAQAKKTLNLRKWPKSEQKIYTFYKGDPAKIKGRFPNIGRL
jgi:hypothetical protein